MVNLKSIVADILSKVTVLSYSHLLNSYQVLGTISWVLHILSYLIFIVIQQSMDIDGIFSLDIKKLRHRKM